MKSTSDLRTVFSISSSALDLSQSSSQKKIATAISPRGFLGHYVELSIGVNSGLHAGFGFQGPN
jgi:hypothetical protein